MRSLRLAAVAALAAAFTAPCPPARAGEPLFLHIRLSDAPEDAAAARREAVWAHSDARARLAIASVCTGCLKPLPALPVVPSRRHDTTQIASHAETTTAAGADASDSASAANPPATLLATAGEP